MDVETAGPVPSTHALLAIGACLVDDPSIGFEVLLRPTTDNVSAEALAVSGLDLAALKVHGADPAEGMQRFADWVGEAAEGRTPVFVGFNAAFDWMFVADYFGRFGVANPFGHSALDIKSLALGALGGEWPDTSFIELSAALGVEEPLPHSALADARLQATVFSRLRAG